MAILIKQYEDKIKYKLNPDSRKPSGILLKYGSVMKAANGSTTDSGEKPIKKKYTYGADKSYIHNTTVPEDFGFSALNSLQSTVNDWEANKFTPAKGLENESYFRHFNVPNYGESGCTTSANYACKQFNSSLPNVYDLLHRTGISSQRTKGETDEYVGIDAWELPQMLQKHGKGKIVFAQDYNDHSDGASVNPSRKKYIEGFNFKGLPLNTILSFGSARGEYVDADANWNNDNKNAMARHTMALVKYDEGTGDAYIYNPGYTNIKGVERGTGSSSVIRVGDSKDADFNWRDFANEYKLVYATTLKGTEDMTYDNLKHYKTRKSNPSTLPLLQNKKATFVQ
jgi:hypothetical protein